MTKKVIVTGGSGKAGRAAVKDLLKHGYEVINTDIAPPPPDLGGTFLNADLTNYGETVEIMRMADQVVHLAAIPAPRRHTEEVTFRVNITSTYNVFDAAIHAGHKRIVWASSETTLGLPFDRAKPDYAPIDEVCTLYPETSYALSKVLMEEMARQFNRWSGIPIIGLRFSNVMEPNDYKHFLGWQDDPLARKWNLWGYVDARDTAQSCRLALEADITGAENFIIAAADTCMTRPNKELLAEVYPEVPIKGDISDHETLLSIEKARKVLGYEPQYSWRDTMGG